MASAHKQANFSITHRKSKTADERMECLLDWIAVYYTGKRFRDIEWDRNYVPLVYLENTRYHQTKEGLNGVALIYVEEVLLEEADPVHFRRLQALMVRMYCLIGTQTKILVRREKETVFSLEWDPENTEWCCINYEKEGEESLVTNALWESSPKNSRKHDTSIRKSTR